ncbi:MAG: DsbC family protein [Gammaproteobacteria bacterium]|jgi:thiol:disulfide interchange protein DsbC|nr:DsbC family protein [Gammaproteobacteria bacterium]
MKFRPFCFAAALLAFANPAWSADPDMAKIRAVLEKTLSTSVDSIVPGPAGLWEVQIGASVYYVSKDGSHLIMGDVIDLATRTNLSEGRRAELVLARLAKVDEKSMIIFEPEKVRSTLTVFTDVDCGYCVKLHREVPKLVEAGVRVRYLMWPRTGIGSESYKRAVSVWCSDDQQKAMATAKFGGQLEPRSCANPVADQYHLGEELGVRATPTLVFEDGQVVPGYIPAARLLAALGIRGGAAAAAGNAKPK